MQTHETHPDHRCKACGCKLDHHNGSTYKCPPTLSYGKPCPFPRWGKKTTDADYDAAIADYWAGNAGTFNPR